MGWLQHTIIPGLSVRLWYLQCISTGGTTVLALNHWIHINICNPRRPLRRNSQDSSVEWRNLPVTVWEEYLWRVKEREKKIATLGSAHHFGGFVQDDDNSSVLAMELPQSCAEKRKHYDANDVQFKFNLSFAETGIFYHNKVSTIAAVAMAPCVTGSSVAMGLTIQN